VLLNGLLKDTTVRVNVNFTLPLLQPTSESPIYGYAEYIKLDKYSQLWDRLTVTIATNALFQPSYDICAITSTLKVLVQYRLPSK
jgi:hypothetical protein